MDKFGKRYEKKKLIFNFYSVVNVISNQNLNIGLNLTSPPLPIWDNVIYGRPLLKRFVEHGEYDKQYYGTSLDAVRTVINSGKICVLNLQPLSLQILHESDLKPYVVFLTPPTLQTYRQQRAKYGDPCKVCS